MPAIISGNRGHGPLLRHNHIDTAIMMAETMTKPNIRNRTIKPLRIKNNLCKQIYINIRLIHGGCKIY